MCTQAFQKKSETQGDGWMMETCEAAELQKGIGGWFLVGESKLEEARGGKIW